MSFLKPPHIQANTVRTRVSGYDVELIHDPNSYIGRFLYYRGMYEEHLMRRFSANIKPGMTIVDVGANIGLHTCIAARLAGPAGRVVSIEPQTSARAFLEANVRLNNFTNVQILDCALGASAREAMLHKINPENDGQATLQDRVSKGQTTGETQRVQVRTLDEIVENLQLQRIDLLKIDAEGSEEEILRGAAAILSDMPPRYLYIECLDRFLKYSNSGSGDILKLLFDRGYSINAETKTSWKRLSGPVEGLNSNLECQLI